MTKAELQRSRYNFIYNTLKLRLVKVCTLRSGRKITPGKLVGYQRPMDMGTGMLHLSLWAAGVVEGKGPQMEWFIKKEEPQI